MITLFYFFGLGLIGTVILFYLLKIPVTKFSVLLGIVMVTLFSAHMAVFSLVALGVLYLKEKVFGDSNKENTQK